MVIISVIIPVYNVEKYLCGCLDSLSEQTFVDYEAICVNDGSIDGSLAILERYAQKDSRFKIINQANKGLSGARNTGMDSAIGKYIFFLDSDDYIHPQALEFMHRCAVENNLELICAGYRGNPNLYLPIKAALDYSNLKKVVYINPIVDYFKNYKNKLPGMVVTKLYKAELVKDMRFIEGRLYEDEQFTAMVMEKCKKTIMLDFAMYNYYYGRSDAITTKVNEQVLMSHLNNVRFLCEHFAYDKNLLAIIKRGKVRYILFGSCLKMFYSLEKNLYNHLKPKFVENVRALLQKRIICYKDFDLLIQYKLYKLERGSIFTLDIAIKHLVRKIYLYIKG